MPQSACTHAVRRLQVWLLLMPLSHWATATSPASALSCAACTARIKCLPFPARPLKLHLALVSDVLCRLPPAALTAHACCCCSTSQQLMFAYYLAHKLLPAVEGIMGLHEEEVSTRRLHCNKLHCTAPAAPARTAIAVCGSCPACYQMLQAHLPSTPPVCSTLASKVCLIGWFMTA